MVLIFNIFMVLIIIFIKIFYMTFYEKNNYGIKL